MKYFYFLIKQYSSSSKKTKKIVSTRACQEIEKLIKGKKKNLVIVTGNSGSGKSAIIQNIAFRYRNQGWTVKPIYEVEKIMATYPPNRVSKDQNPSYLQ